MSAGMLHSSGLTRQRQCSEWPKEEHPSSWRRKRGEAIAWVRLWWWLVSSGDGSSDIDIGGDSDNIGKGEEGGVFGCGFEIVAFVLGFFWVTLNFSFNKEF